MASLRDALTAIKSVASDDIAHRLAALTQKIDQAHVDLSDRYAELTRLKSRFSRPTLNIGVVGRAGNGKSRLLQSLTGLSSREIPDGSGGHCTGAQSIIVHDEQSSGAEVYFHTEQEFFTTVLAPYYAKLGLGPAPRKKSDFADTALPPLPDKTTEPIARTKYDYLKKYKDHYQDYQGWLKPNPDPKQIHYDEIRSFVAQDTPEKDRAYFNFLAVSHVKIYCKFPAADVTAISVIDMPGLGDTGIGHAERLIASLAEDIDWVLFVKMPQATRAILEDVDHQLYETAASALCDALPIEKWSTMVINQTGFSSPQGDNAQNCDLIINELKRSPIKVANIVQVDCANQKEVTEKLLDPLVSLLATNIEQLDRDYASHCDTKLRQLKSDIANITKEAHACVATGNNGNAGQNLYFSLFQETIKNLNFQLQNLLRRRRVVREQEDQNLETMIEKIVEEASKTKLPTEQEVEIQKAQPPGTYHAAYDHFLNLKRTELSRQFLRLDESFTKSFTEVQSDIGKTLRDLGCFPRTLFPGADHEIISEIRDYLKEHNPDLTELIAGFELIAEFKLDYRGAIQHRIRKHLDTLDPESPSKNQLDGAPIASHVIQNVEMSYDQARHAIADALRGMNTEPSQAIFAFVEEFVDRVCRSETCAFEWNIYMFSLRADIWPNQFSQLSKHSRLHQDAERAIDRLNETNAAFLFS